VDNNEAVKKFKIKSCFAYHEERTSDTEVTFGWIPMEKDNLEMPFVVSYGSKAKSVNDNDAKWSKDAGINAASLSDYMRYFTSLTGDSPSDFLGKWNEDSGKLEEFRKTSNDQYRDGEGEFLISLANLLKEGDKFTQYGRIFKLIRDNT
jgi:hypothetical protein